jgi:hypothetical protein
MIRHIVMFTLTAPDAAQRAAHGQEMRQRLEALVGVVPGLRSMSLNADLGLIDSHRHLVLISEHDNNAALEGYQAHPAHKEVAAFIQSVTTAERATVDYEV